MVKKKVRKLKISFWVLTRRLEVSIIANLVLLVVTLAGWFLTGRELKAIWIWFVTLGFLIVSDIVLFVIARRELLDLERATLDGRR